MSTASEDAAAFERIEQEAASWVLRQDRGLNGEEQDDLSEWLAADPRHGISLARHRQNWDRLDQLVRWRPEHAGVPNRDLLAPKPVQWWRALSLTRPSAISFSLAAAVALIAALIIGRRHSASNLADVVAVTAPAAAVLERTLDDGTVVALRAGSQFTVAYTSGERRLRLDRGEAHFTVARDARRPFIVSVAGVEVQVLGTQFDVQLAPDELSVLVNEGRVRVGSIPVVQAGEKAVVPLQSGPGSPRVETVSSAAMDHLLMWRPEQFDFSGSPLSEIVAAFNRHNVVQLTIADPALAGIKLSARLRSDNIDGFVRLLESGFDVRAERSGDTILLRKAP